MAFFLHRAEPDKGAGKRTFNGAGSKISQDHPLNMPPGAFPEQSFHFPAKPEQPMYYAGKPWSRCDPVRSVLTGSDIEPVAPGGKPKRHEYQHPTYTVNRSQNGTRASDLIYQKPEDPPPKPASAAKSAASTADQGHPLAPAYEMLAEFVPQLPRDEQGGVEEGAMRRALEHVGVQLSLDGFAELLARCDVSPDGFPPFGDFLLCVSRPERPPPSQPTSMGGAEALPASMAQMNVGHTPPVLMSNKPQPPLVADFTSAKPPPPPPVPEEEPEMPEPQPPAEPEPPPPPPMQPPRASVYTPGTALRGLAQAKEGTVMPSYEAQKTWGQMKMERDLQNAQLRQPTPQPTGPPPAPVPTLQLGLPSVRPIGTNYAVLLKKNLARKPHASSQAFTNSFNPDFFVF